MKNNHFAPVDSFSELLINRIVSHSLSEIRDLETKLEKESKRVVDLEETFYPSTHFGEYDHLRTELLEEAASKPVAFFHQFDCFPFDGIRDDYTDKDGDATFYGKAAELRNSNTAVRLQIPKGLPKKDAVRAVKKLLKWVEKDLDKYEKDKEQWKLVQSSKKKDGREEIPF